MFQLAVLVSGSGTNLQNIIDKSERGIIKSNVALVIADRPCRGIERAQKKNIPTCIVKRGQRLSDNIHEQLLKHPIDFIILAGFLSILNAPFCEKWRNKIINIHPSLLPKYGGHNMYGSKVHQAVLENKDRVSGATVHFVNEVIDGGAIIIQKSCKVSPNDTVELLQKKVQQIEYSIMIEAIQQLESGIE